MLVYMNQKIISGQCFGKVNNYTAKWLVLQVLLDSGGNSERPISSGGRHPSCTEDQGWKIRVPERCKKLFLNQEKRRKNLKKYVYCRNIEWVAISIHAIVRRPVHVNARLVQYSLEQHARKSGVRVCGDQLIKMKNTLIVSLLVFVLLRQPSPSIKV